MVLLGGGHDGAYASHSALLRATRGPVAAINVDAHLDVRPYPQGGHSGSPFRQAFEHPTHPLKSGRYMVLGAQRQSVARAHWKSSSRSRLTVAYLRALLTTLVLKMCLRDKLKP